MSLKSRNNPAALIDVPRMARNIDRMQERMSALGAGFRPHVKTTKCEQVADAQIAAGARCITVSTLKEADQFYAAGIRDIVYAVGMAPGKLAQTPALRRQGCDLKIVADSVACAEAITAFGAGLRLTLPPQPALTDTETEVVCRRTHSIATVPVNVMQAVATNIDEYP